MLRAASVQVVVVLAAALVGCEAPPGVSPSPTTGREIDCHTVLEMTPAEAEAYVTAQGFTVSWRYETTTEDGPFAEIVTGTPDGVITEVVTEGNQVIIFVTPPDDPLLDERPIGQECP